MLPARSWIRALVCAATAAPVAMLAAPPSPLERPSTAGSPAAADAPAWALGSALRWRLIGPFRGGRVLAVSGVPGQPETFYFGAVGGGVWRTVDAGRVWTPIFAGPPSGSIGALAVAPANADVIYAGTGEADMRSDVSYGDGMYRSADGGRTFQAIGLRDSRQIGRILVDPHDPDVVLVAALGHGFGPNPERGVFRTADGGKSWQRVLHRDGDGDAVGAIDLAADPDDPRTVYAALWNVRRPPWSTYAPLSGPGGGLFRSGDGGLTWKEITGHGLPAGPLGRIGLAVAGRRPGEPPSPGGASRPRENRRRVYALIDDPRQPGLYRSDDGGESWLRVGTDRRISGRAWYFGGLTADPRDPDTVYVANVSLYRSTDGGHTFQAIKGAPGGDDYHSLWIDPTDPRRMILGCDQGAVVTVDGALTWSSWFNQPTAQIYHVATDDRFPYTVYGAQQDSGTAAVASRSDSGQITYRDWFSTGTGESGYILPDPTDPDTVYGGNPGGQLFRFSRRTSQIQDISPTMGPAGGEAGSGIVYRYPWTPALAISPHPPHAIYQGSQFVHRSTDRGMSWTVISPDLTMSRQGAAGAASGRGGAAAAGERGGSATGGDRDKAVIYSIAPSPVRDGQIWAGTDNGRVQLTLDEGKTWQDVTPPGLAAWSMISLVEASHHDAGTAYAAIDRHQMDDLRPYALRTRDFGKSWTPIAAGIAAGAYVHAVREDPWRRGLLYAGTESGVYVSFDDGDHWQSLQLNLPASSVRDLAIHGDDLVAATHGRSFWVLDGLAPLRQLDAAVAASPVHLFAPGPAVRKRRGENRETPLPPETPAGANPPTGALIDYWLAAEPAGELTLEILDERGETVRRFTSGESVRQLEEAAPFPTFWFRPAGPPAKRAGLNRFVWDLRYPPPPALHPQAAMDAVYGEDTPLEPEGPLVLPGTYRLRITAGGRSSTASLRVELDPRLEVPAVALASQLALARRIDAALAESYRALRPLRQLDRQLEPLDLGKSAAALRRKVNELTGGEPGFPPVPEKEPGFATIHAGLAALAVSVGSGDAAPTTQAAAAFAAYRAQLDRALAAWANLRAADLPALNRKLAARGLPQIELSRVSP
jgi:photosystem II stability/assembly factor-like uncharacterized protein